MSFTSVCKEDEENFACVAVLSVVSLLYLCFVTFLVWGLYIEAVFSNSKPVFSVKKWKYLFGLQACSWLGRSIGTHTSKFAVRISV